MSRGTQPLEQQLESPILEITTAIPIPIPDNLDTVRGLACLLLVCYHVVGSNSTYGLRLPPTSDWHYAMSSFEFIRMPIFTILSGFLYGRFRVESSTIRTFLGKKLRRIVVPFVVATTVYWFLRRLTVGEDRSFLTALFWTNEHLWYLQALLLLFVFAAFVDMSFMPSSSALFLIAIGLALISATSHFGTLLSADGAIYLAPFFIFGIILASTPRLLEDRNIGLICGVVAMVILAIQQASLNGLTRPIAKQDLIATLCGVGACLFLLQFMRPIRLLADIGHHSYTIYLWHILFAAAIRMALIGLGFEATPFLFVLGVSAGIAGPLTLHRFASRTALLSIPLLGSKPGSRS